MYAAFVSCLVSTRYIPEIYIPPKPWIKTPFNTIGIPKQYSNIKWILEQ